METIYNKYVKVMWKNMYLIIHLLNMVQEDLNPSILIGYQIALIL